MKLQLMKSNTIDNLTTTKLVIEYHSLARELTTYNTTHDPLPENKKIRKLVAKTRLQDIMSEMKFRKITIHNLGYTL